MIVMQSVTSSSIAPATVKPVNGKVSDSVPSVAPSAATADKVSISREADNLRDIPGLGLVDISTIPIQTPAAAHFGAPETIKAAMKEDFLSNGIYVDDNYIQALWDSGPVMGPLPPGVELPTPPAWWRGGQFS